MTASVAFTVIYAVRTGDAFGTAALAVTAVLINLRHIENLKRIKNGTEAHFSLIWKRKDEVSRIGMEEEDRNWTGRGDKKK